MVKRIHVKPNPNGGWDVLCLSTIESFVDDFRRYGIKIAVHNLLWILKWA